MPRRKQKVLRESTAAVGYVRTSTRQREVSLDAQAERVKAYCGFKELELVETIREEGVSAFKPLADRPGGARLLEALEAGEVGHVVGVKLDRLFRNVTDCLSVVTDWQYEGVTLHLTDLGGQAFDTSSAMGKFFLTLMAAVAEWERAIIGERTHEGLAHKKREGEPLGTAPIGKVWNKETHRLEANAREAEAIRLIVEMHGTGIPMRKIVEQLNEIGLYARRSKKHPERGGRWHLTTVARIIARETGGGT